MDKLTKILNQRVAEKVARATQPTPDQMVPKKDFAEVLESKQNAPQVLDGLLNDIKGKADDFQVQSGADIKVSFNNFDVEKSSDFDPKKKVADIFGSLNEDMLSMDSTIEVLADSNVKLSRRQLLAYQAGIGQMTINTELFSKMAQSISQNLNTILNTNVG